VTPQEASAPSGPALPAAQPPASPKVTSPENPAALGSPATLLARAVVASLVEAGVKRVVISPGSRNAPLTYALADAAQAGYLQLRVVVDERSAAFVALGASRSDWLHEGLARPAPAAGTPPSARLAEPCQAANASASLSHVRSSRPRP